MAQQVKKKFLDPEVISYFDDQIVAVDQKVDQEILDRQSAIEGIQEQITNLGDGYATDQELSDAVTSLSGLISDEATARSDADNALDARLDVIEAFKYENIVYVSKNGLDTNNGTQHFPFLTITAAQNAITDASPTKRYVIKVAPGSYTETALALKANVFIVGEGNKESVRITGPVSMHSSFSGTGDHRSGFHKVTLLSAADFNWATVTSGAGKLYISETVFVSTLNMYGHNNAIAQAQFNASVIFGTFTVSGINVGVFTNNICYGNVTLNQHPGGGMVTTISATGGYCGGTFRLNSTTNDFNRRSSAFLRNFWSENLISDGPVSYADVDLTSGSKQGAQTLNGGQVIPLNPKLSHDLETKMIKPVATNAHNNGDWGRQWFFNFSYVYASSGTDMYISTVGSSYDPAGDDAGRSVFIDADGYGLKPDVNGGNVQISTAATSGTGVRGKVVLNGAEVDVSSKKITNLADGVSSSDAVNKGQLDAAIDAIPEVDLTPYYTKTEVDNIESGLQGQIDTEKGRIDAILLASDADKDSFKEIVDLINSVDTENDEAFASYVLSNNEALAQEVLDRQSGDEQTLELANTYTFNAIAAIPPVDLSAYETIDNVDAKDADTLALANTYTDEAIAAIPPVDLSGYYTKTEVDSIESSLDSRLDTLEAKGFAKGSQVIGANLEFIDLDREYATVLSVSVGRLAVHEGEDYTVSVVGGVTRLTWIGSLAHPDGVEKIETGDKVFWAGSY